ncbi:MAG TPA: ABC transporter permease [Verrucomicrobiae bacterium]|jgi:putative ABC transport system permease protein|nr:ABC transporter permease [Verrucomicrobiae bacterium]
MKRVTLFFDELMESFFMAMGAIAAHKLRSALTLLGVLVGVFSIIVVMTAMRAMQKQIESDMNRLGASTFKIQTWPEINFEGPEGWQKYARRKRIKLEQGLAVEQRATLPQNVGLESDLTEGTARSIYNKGIPNIWLQGETPGSFPAQNWVINEGRGLQESDMDGQRNVCVLGNTLATNLFPFGTAVGERVNVDNYNYTIVGVLQPNGSMAGGREDNFVIVPLPTGLMRYVDKRWEDLSILVQARSAADYDDTVDQVRGVMRLLRKVPPGTEDDFEIISNDSLMDQMRSITHNIKFGISLISSIALMAAGIGIMNIMLVSVTERTREIGVRRAIGAKKRNIMAQFIMEAIMLCEVGGVIGVVCGVAGGDVAAHFMKLPQVLPVDWIVIGLAICSLVGIIFGAYPAYKAANLDPIESLRYE